MSRRFIILSFALLLILQLAPLSANACEKGASCEIDRKCEKTETGVRCTVTAKGETTVAAVRECVRSMAPKHHQTEGVEMSFEEIDGGIVVISTSDDAETVKKLQAMAGSCDKDQDGCCAKAAHHQKTAEAGCCSKHEQAQKADAGCCSKAKAAAKDCDSKAKTETKTG